MIAARLSRGLRLLVGLGLLAGACSHRTTARPSAGSSTLSATATATPTPTATATVTATQAPPTSPPKAPATAPASKAPPALPRPAATTPPRAPTPAGAPVSIPLPGTYVYDLSGTTQTPLLGIAQPYQPGATLTIDVEGTSPQAGGTEVEYRGTSSQDQVQTTTREVFGGSRVVLSLTNLTFLGLASYDCTYTPPPEILPIPVQVVTLPTQTWSGAGCSGSLQLGVQGPETTTAGGQTFTVWKVHSLVHYVAQSSVDVTLDTTSLFSPQLGMAVTADAATSGKVAGSPFSSHQVTTLKSHP
ncbi:MAG: hypothetical protein ABR532_04635 [Candidatus Dormibacteria bacterium]